MAVETTGYRDNDLADQSWLELVPALFAQEVSQIQHLMPSDRVSTKLESVLQSFQI